MLTDLVKEIGNRPFSLIVDESMDVSVVKYLAFMVRYHSPSRKAVVTECTSAFAESLYYLTKEYLQKVGLNIQNLVGLGTDGVASMCTAVHENSSLFTLLKKDVPNLQLVKCVCHTLHLAASHAAVCLPDDLEYLVRETRNWFASSPLWRQNYEDLFKAMNDGEMPRKLVQLSGTRWLAWSRALAVITAQWDELKAHFNQYISTLSAHKCERRRRPNDARGQRGGDTTTECIAAGVDFDELKSQWERLPGVNWKEFFDGYVPSNSCKFWCGVHEYREDDEPVLRSIPNFTLRVLSLPFFQRRSRVERAFSVMNDIETKARNRMRLEILMPIMRIRLRVIWSGCCKEFEPTDEMYALFNCSNVVIFSKSV
ncbi:Zinc finger MYM-type protein 1 [Frankliniella fusca]|uniref:Zinc finger MYM-type protein 1 n=1 Tax=Frankliniella fusca TaxID=407009 RepID=A0AAE1L769_9NEOP|nr:Zinc finger MYM-type protein 1 [Frankliniella fusca]